MAFVLSSAYNVASLSCLQCGEIEPSSTSDCWFSNTKFNAKLMPFFSRCADYIQLDRGDFGQTESCGNDTETSSSQLEQRAYVVHIP